MFKKCRKQDEKMHDANEFRYHQNDYPDIFVGEAAYTRTLQPADQRSGNTHAARMQGRVFDFLMCPLHIFLCFCTCLDCRDSSVDFYQSENLVRNKSFIDFIGGFHKYIDASQLYADILARMYDARHLVHNYPPVDFCVGLSCKYYDCIAFSFSVLQVAHWYSGQSS